jgi:acyl-coenzyme A synthetase/AMP-(fatty) acid ligase
MKTRAHDADAARYYDQGFWRHEDLWEDVEARVAAHPDKPALRCGDAAIGYGELRTAAIALSQRLATAGIERGDVVILCGRHSIEGVVALFACFHRGVTLAPLPPMFSAHQLRTVAQQTAAKAAVGFGADGPRALVRGIADAVETVIEIADGDLMALAATEVGDVAREPTDPDALSLLMHSSGTTAAPKGIAHSTNTVRAGAEGVLARWELTGDDTLLVVAEFGFVGGLVFGYLPALLAGATAVLLPKWDPAEALRLIEEQRCAFVLLMPTHAQDVLFCEERSHRDLSSLRVLVAPGLSAERRVQMRDAFGVPPLGDYGLSEVPGNSSHPRDAPWDKILTTDGPPFDGNEVRILDEDDRPVPAGEPGQIVLTGPSRFLGFFRNDELTAASLTDWGGYRTGDVGTLDADGYLTFLGRSKDIIRRGGVTIVPAEIEPVILRHEAVREVALVGVEDERLGERSCAALLLQPGAEPPTLEQLQDFLEGEGVAKYCWPEYIEVFEEFPRTSSLKAVKRDIVGEVEERLGIRERARA